jgi:purine nucleoside permease
MLYAPGLYTGYGAKTLPAIREAIELRRWSDAIDYIPIVADSSTRPPLASTRRPRSLTPRLGAAPGRAPAGPAAPNPLLPRRLNPWRTPIPPSRHPISAAARCGADPSRSRSPWSSPSRSARTGATPRRVPELGGARELDQKIEVPGVDHPVLTDGNGTIGVVSGTTVRASNQIMALVMSGKFDFSKTYWVVNGIAGVNPAIASIGSAAWAHYVIDGDVAYEIDAREADPSWPYAIIPIGSKVPNEKPKREGWEPDTMAYELNPSLVDWAYALTKDTPIPDTDADEGLPGAYAGLPNAQKPPFVLCGETFGSCRYWHGKAMTQWARTGPASGPTARASSRCPTWRTRASPRRSSALGMGRVDFQRVMFLRTASNYCMQAPKPGREQEPPRGVRGLPSLARGRVPRRKPRDPRARRALGPVPRQAPAPN